MWPPLSVRELIGKIFINISNDDDVITFTTIDGDIYQMYHDQDCCESVTIEDICGDLNDLIGSPIISASEDSNKDCKQHGEYSDESCTWTFYNFSTEKGHVTIRWYGTSNGYYSESVDLYKVNRTHD